MMLRTVNTLAAPGEPVFFVSGDRYPLIDYHLNRINSDVVATGIPFVNGDVVNSIMPRVIGKSSRFWVVEIERNLGDPNNRVIPWLDAHYQRVLRIPIDYNGITLYSSGDKTVPDSQTVLASIIHEARPGDVIRVGVPGGIPVQLQYGGQIIASAEANLTWQLVQFPVYAAVPNGDYSLQIGQTRYPIPITHSQPDHTHVLEDAITVEQFDLLAN